MLPHIMIGIGLCMMFIEQGIGYYKIQTNFGVGWIGFWIIVLGVFLIPFSKDK